jgi:Ribbon-helix-helix protein, copG family
MTPPTRQALGRTPVYRGPPPGGVIHNYRYLFSNSHRFSFTSIRGEAIVAGGVNEAGARGVEGDVMGATFPKMVGTRLTEDEAEKLARLVKQRGRTASALLREMVRRAKLKQEGETGEK